ncbi:pentapeptide repeat-containing protein [filamentous cyanobacterium LEGE 11480]|uniref:Pentapeptide repeat-containing protein n=1 Tax=Romeriopsis navalis LEGE 11480 TaxID=2777977 RepID=A0A928Z3H5_9CYAN|nr:pentapeptide repeat-containing protein [Romeriopsis navalis LEGE 11480]
MAGQVGWEFLLGPRATLGDMTDRVFQTWQHQDLFEVVNSNFFIRPDRTAKQGQEISVSTENLKELLAIYREQLGPLKSFHVVEEKIFRNRNRLFSRRGNVYASYKLQAEFAKAPAVIRLYLDLYGSWRVHHFIIKSSALSPCLSQVDWQLCSARQARRNTPQRIVAMRQKIQTLRQCVACDLSFLDFRKMDLAGVNFARANLTGTNFNQANLQSADLRQTKLRRAQFKAANLQGANLAETTGAGAIFYQADLQNANLKQARFPRANFEKANLQGSNLDRSDLEEANFYQADLHHAHLNQTSLFRADFRQARMTRTQLNGANLQCASLGGAAALRVQINGALMDGMVLPNQAINLPTTLARRRDVVLRC